MLRTQLLRSRRSGQRRRLLALTSLGVAGLLAGLLSGCSAANPIAVNAAATSTTAPAARSYAAAAGNWKFTPAAGSRMAAFAGSLTVSGTTLAGTLHPLAAACAGSTAAFPVTGSIDASNHVAITSTDFAGGALSITGDLAPDNHSLLNPTITVTSGACIGTKATLQPRVTGSATAQQFQPVTGNYTGTFTDSSGVTLAVSASLSQPTTPDANGVYHLTGSATFPGNPCLTAPVVTDSTVTGDLLEATYTQQSTGDTVSAKGTFSSDAATLTITTWTLTGCGDDTGTGLLTRQTP